MAEWLKALVSKTGVRGNSYRGFESLPLRQRPGIASLFDDRAEDRGAWCVPGEVSELADERDLGSRAERRRGSSPLFPTVGATLPGRRLYQVQGYVAGEPIQYPLGEGLTMELAPMRKPLR